jgi:serine/threonine-protein kinase
VADTLPVHPGDLVADKYVVESVIGRGGMGVVVAARHHRLDQRVAIKFLDRHMRNQDEAARRFLREARAVANLKSQHVVRVIDTGTLPSGEPYLVMERLEGDDLEGVIHERGPIDASLACDWMAQACESLAEAHAAGLVHRDLKPSNLFLARTVGGAEIIKVLDFGIAKAVASEGLEGAALTGDDVLLGSPKYMAPEQMRSSRDVDARADVWALGIVLFELLTKQRPFQAAALPDLCVKVATEPPRSLADLRPELPAGLVDVISRCLAKDPADRFANAGELASALEPFVSSRSRTVIERARLATFQPPASILLSAPELPAVRPGPSQSIELSLEASTPSDRRTRMTSPSPPAAPKRTATAVWGVGAAVVAGLVVAVVWMGSSGFARPTGAAVSVSAAAEEPASRRETARAISPSSEGAGVSPLVAAAEAGLDPASAVASARAGGAPSSAPLSPHRRTEVGPTGEHAAPAPPALATPWPDGSDIPGVR